MMGYIKLLEVATGHGTGFGTVPGSDAGFGRVPGGRTRLRTVPGTGTTNRSKLVSPSRTVSTPVPPPGTSLRYPIVDGWPLMSSPGPLFIILGAYLLFVLKIGPKIMETRPAFQLTNTLIWYNGLQVLLSIWIARLCIRVDAFSHIFTTICNFNPIENQHNHHMLTTTAWWYFSAKIVELLDTVFFVMRKKQNQVTFLHVYHHAETALLAWCYLKFFPSEQGLVIAFLNSSVHIVMYSYYLIAALGPEYKKYLWWKKYMTGIQLVQFGLMLTYLISTLALDCPLSKAVTYVFIINSIVLLCLFLNFYQKEYTEKTALRKEAKVTKKQL